MRIALFRSKSFISRAIRWQTRGDFSHAAIVSDGGTLWEAKEFVGVHRLDHFMDAVDPGETFEMFRVETTPHQTRMMIDWLNAQCGHKYDYRAVLRFLTREPVEEDGDWFCSELAFEAFYQAGVELFRDTRGWQVCPDMLKRSTLVKPWP